MKAKKQKITNIQYMLEDYDKNKTWKLTRYYIDKLK